MEQLPISFVELLELVLYFSSLVLAIGIIFQLVMVYRQDRKISLKAILIIFLIQIIVLGATTWLWLKWPMGLKILYGPILFPALIAEILIMPLLSGFFNYRIFGRKKVV